MTYRNPGAARAGGYVLALAGLLVALGLLFHPVPPGGYEERPSILANTPWWGPIQGSVQTTVILSVPMLRAGRLRCRRSPDPPATTA